ncbi:MAG TPA: hypothetical protein VEH04_16360 [Verrucomicrobiae bacterium]|nr:hypothetical protein [Verrucomicrobiae bacterium]
MKRFLFVACVSLAAAAVAQESEVELLKRQLQQMQENFERVQREQREQIEALSQRLNSLTNQASASAASVAASSLSEAEPAWNAADPVRIGNGGKSFVDLSLIATFAAGTSTAEDIQGGTQLGGHDPAQRGFTVQGVELNLQGAVDPYFGGNASILFSIDAEGESFVELEEAWLETVSLPGNLQVRAGQLLSEFGRHNTQHPHSWAFVDSPLASARFLGADGLRNPGARISWLAPTPFYSELSLGIQNSHGETAASFRSSGHSHGDDEHEALPLGFRHPDNDRGVKAIDDLLFTPRYALSFDLSEAQTLLFGLSGAFGPNSSGAGGDTRTAIGGADVYWKWKPARAQAGFPFVSFQAEAMVRRYELGAFNWDENENDAADEGEVTNPGGLPASLRRESVTDWGFYSQVLYGFRKGWVGGVRWDYVTGERGDYEQAGLSFNGAPLGRDPMRDQRWRLSPNLTWYPTEFSKLRLQYNYDDRRNIGVDHSLWLQFEFLLGAHGAHPF